MDKRMKRVVLASSFGTVLEWYDFFLYGLAAALVLPHLFFPQSDPVVGTLLSFAAYATGFLARPLGGVISGHFGDRFSRKTTLMATLMVMGSATFLIGLLPTYAQIGIWAPVLLVTLRVVQGLATGGEWGGASLLTLEHATGRRGYWGSFISMAVFGGLILGNLIFLLLGATLTRDQLLAWGWRLPFLLSIVLVAIGIFIRRRVDESPQFEQLTEEVGRSQSPLLEALRTQPRNIIAIFLMRLGQNTSFYIITVFCLSYATSTLHIDQSVTLTALLVGSTLAAAACPFWGALADRIGYTRIMMGSLIVSALIAAPLFMILETRSAVAIVGSLVVAIAGVTAASDAIQPGFFTSMFGTRIRYSGVSIGREAGTIVGGGLAPIIAAALFAQTGSWWAVAGWMAFTALAGLIGVALARPVAQFSELEKPGAVVAQGAGA
jgi:MFS transporter, MHS family, shikimate and dehydroshikimate transport protein